MRAFIDQIWDAEIVPTLTEYIRIPNKSPAFEPDWAKLGHMERAVDMFAAWAREKLKAVCRARRFRSSACRGARR